MRVYFMKRQNSLTAKLQKCDVEIKFYVKELKKENLNLHKQIAKLHVQIESQQNQIRAQPEIRVKTIDKFIIKKSKKKS